MTQMVTRCPKCATAFRITSTQLESAKGAVRCGSCLHIFKAQDHLVKTVTATTAGTVKAEVKTPEQPNNISRITQPEVPPAKPVPQKTTPSTTKSEASAASKPIIDKAKVLEDEEDVLISDDMDKTTEKSSTYEFDGFIDINLHPKQTVSLFEREIRYEEDKEETEVADESWAEELLDDDKETLTQLKKPISHKTPITVADSPSQDPHTPEDQTKTTESQKPEEHYSGPVFSLISDAPEVDAHMFSEEFLNATRPMNTTTSQKTTESSAYAAALFEEDNDETDEEEKTTSKRPIKSATKMRAFDTSRAALLMNIMPAPVEFTAKRMRRWYQKKLWSSLALVMILALFFQLAYFKFDYFSRVEPYRTFYVLSCPLLGCKIPTLIDTTQIATTNLIVRKHPDAENALIVDVILINHAPFEQPFPDLVLSFSKMDDTPVASRRFTPKEYLGGELAGMEHIPMSQPVHVALELADPGPDAVNYHLSIP